MNSEQVRFVQIDDDDDDARDTDRTALAQAAQELVDANHKVDDLEKEITELNASIALLVRRQASPSSAHTSESTNSDKTRRSTKIDNVPIFHGDGDKDALSFESWYRQIENKLAVNADHFDNDLSKQVYIEGRIQGTVAANLAPYLRTDNPDRVKTSKDLLKHLWDEYHDPNEYTKALDDFASLQMDHMGEDFTLFKHKFVRLAGAARKPKADWKFEFKRKIPASLANYTNAQYLDSAISFETYVRHIAEIAQNYVKSRAAKADKAAKPSKAPSTNNPKPVKPSVPRSSSTTSTPSAHPKPSDEEMRKLATERRCFVCREKGHRSRECPTRQNDGNSAAEKEARVQAIIDKHNAWMASREQESGDKDSEN